MESVVLVHEKNEVTMSSPMGDPDKNKRMLLSMGIPIPKARTDLSTLTTIPSMWMLGGRSEKPEKLEATR